MSYTGCDEIIPNSNRVRLRRIDRRWIYRFCPSEATTEEGPTTWAVASVDTAAIRIGFNVEESPYESLEQKIARINSEKKRDEDTTLEVDRQVKKLLDDGYEPFAASIVSSIYNNEKVWFFRKKLGK